MIVWRYTYSTADQKLIVEEGEKEGFSVYVKRRYPYKPAPIQVRYIVAIYEGAIKNNALWLKERDDVRAMDAFEEYYKKKIDMLEKERDGYVRRINYIAKKGVELRNDGSCE